MDLPLVPARAVAQHEQPRRAAMAGEPAPRLAPPFVRGHGFFVRHELVIVVAGEALDPRGAERQRERAGGEPLHIERRALVGERRR